MLSANNSKSCGHQDIFLLPYFQAGLSNKVWLPYVTMNLLMIDSLTNFIRKLLEKITRKNATHSILQTFFEIAE